MSPKLSVVLCTYNRSQLLRIALDSLVGQSLVKSEYELLVVDNSSTDDTTAAVKAFQTQYASPEIILVSEARQGLGYARNAGYKNARGRYVAFIDDDCVATKDWLQMLLDCFEQIYPQPWSVGGPIRPVYDVPRPVWFKDSYETDTWGERPRLLKRRESFTGCNMSFRKDVLERYGGFDTTLDMKGESLSLAGETDLYRRMWSAEGTRCLFYYSPHAVMHHRIDAFKMTVSYQLKRAFAAGQVSCTIAQVEPIFRRCLLFVGSMVLLLWHTVLAVLRIRPGRDWRNWAIEQLRHVAYNIGRLFSYFGIRMDFRQRNST
ncbi:MAG: glycosyltransferase family 2 protein [Nitrospirae bacterium]|nr:MAG: glycosyltransferase family 2 protein [Nitrospirota bacterium]